jgi:hypothetical protein
MTRKAYGLVLSGLLAGMVPAAASPWAEVGDNQLRGDLELLAASGAIGDTTSHWPIPWSAVTTDLDAAALDGQPASVQAAGNRILGQARAETGGGINGGFAIDATNRPSLVYGFDSLGRGEGQTQLSLGFNASAVSARLSVGFYSDSFHKHDTKLMLDNSYIAAKVGGALVYAGELSHWWGPGWMSALSLSNNARPMPQIGIERLNDTAFTWPVLRWLGPWQGEFFVGVLNDARVARNTVYDGLRFTFNPAPGLQIGIARTDMMCGTGHPCSPLRDYFSLSNDPTHVNRTNDEGEFDIKYSHPFSHGRTFELYAQLMNEDSSPFTHSDTSHLAGGSLFLPVGSGSPLRLTAEFTDSLSTLDIFSFGTPSYGMSYTNATYPDGMRYRGRTLGFSLDDDSRLLSLQGAWSDNDRRFYQLSIHHATIGNAHSTGSNIVSPVPVSLTMEEAKVGLPFRHFQLDLAARYQDRQIAPKTGASAAIEGGLSWRF